MRVSNMALKPRNHTLKRCLGLVKRGSGTYAEVAEELGIHPRTVERDCHALRDAGFNIKMSGGRMTGRFEIIEEPTWFLAMLAALMNAIGLRKSA